MATSPKPSLILLHGAGLGRWIWDSVIPELTAPAQAVDLPGRGDGTKPGNVTLKQCIDLVRDKARALTTRSILVGHSISGEVALGVAAAHPEKVAAVVLVGGVAPESGKSFMSLMPLPQRLFLHVLLKRARGGIKLPESLARKQYCNDLDESTTNMVLSRLTPEAPRLYLDKLEWSALDETIPRFYIKLLDDKSVPPKQQDKIIRRIRATREESLKTGHLPMLARPRELAAALNRLVATI
jgi:pimeloyl-ACP methyl ester carboxylesterase